MSGNWSSSYWELTRSKSDCVLFIRDDQSDVLIPELQEKLSAAGIRKAYFDCRSDWIPQHIAGSIGQQLRLDHAPYASWAPPTQNRISVWVPFLDDMVSLARTIGGAAIVVDNADQLLANDSETFFGLIKAFLIPFGDWLERDKPCHLCLQMRPDPLIKQFFG